MKFCNRKVRTLYISEIEKNTRVTEENFELELSKLVRFFEKIDCKSRMRDVISIQFFSRNKYGSKSESIYNKDHINQCENLRISQDFITCVFRNLHFLAPNMYQKYTQIGKFKKYLGTQKNLTLKMSPNVHISSRRMYSINYHHKKRGSPGELGQERGLTIEI